MKKKFLEKKSTKIILSVLTVAGMIASAILATEGEEEYHGNK